MEKSLSYYMSLPYTFIMQHHEANGDSYYFIRVLELSGCMSHGDTPEEALKNIREAMEGYIEVKLECGDPIPEPKEEDDYSGKTVLRLPKSLHRDLSIQAALEGVSLNTYMLHKLSQ